MVYSFHELVTSHDDSDNVSFDDVSFIEPMDTTTVTGKLLFSV